VWCCYRLVFEELAPPGRDIASTATAFADSVIAHFAGNGSWVAASAPVSDSSIDIWFSLPVLPTDQLFGEIWRAQMRAHGISGARVPNRN
jgi:hypothetical protein